ncbi:MAG TPA: hypothetical protein VFY60_00845 [Pyrinomonadaceae bacterium]|nr:hypothetical protein [Pyrinomonadaceae bacterium]
MKSTYSFLSLLLLVLCSPQLSYANKSAEALARKAVLENAAEATPAIEELRSLGPAGLQTLMAQYAAEIKHHIAKPSVAPDERWQRIAVALDNVAQQKNSYIAGLYWHTDIETAKKASAESGKPILSLRLLGKLTDEFSCANSRFFRTVLYPNDAVATMLRERFVLHWQSVRPVPTVTIDFGDGRKLERTLTGNSIHYILDSQARPIDALPGLYGPQAFLRGLENAESIFKSLEGKNAGERYALLTRYYRDQHNKISLEWTRDTQKIGGKVPEGFRIIEGMDGQPDALSVAPLAVTKAAVEINFLRAMTFATDSLGQITDEEAWKKIAQLHSSLAVLDDRSVALIKRQNPALSDEELGRLLRKFQELIALDTVRNEYLLHSKLYTWLMRDPTSGNLEKLNEKVYASLFLTPGSDPWLGLFSTDVYTALDNGGVVKP